MTPQERQNVTRMMAVVLGSLWAIGFVTGLIAGHMIWGL